jgi:hypothetical protein
MKRIAILGTAVLFGALTALGGIHSTHAVTQRSYDTCHFSKGNSFKVYSASQEDQIEASSEQTGGTCSGPIA